MLVERFDSASRTNKSGRPSDLLCLVFCVFVCLCLSLCFLFFVCLVMVGFGEVGE